MNQIDDLQFECFPDRHLGISNFKWTFKVEVLFINFNFVSDLLKD